MVMLKSRTGLLRSYRPPSDIRPILDGSSCPIKKIGCLSLLKTLKIKMQLAIQRTRAATYKLMGPIGAKKIVSLIHFDEDAPKDMCASFYQPFFVIS